MVSQCLLRAEFGRRQSNLQRLLSLLGIATWDLSAPVPFRTLHIDQMLDLLRLSAGLHPMLRRVVGSHPFKIYNTTWFDMWRIKDGKAAKHWDPALLNEAPDLR
ncbi:hypothetical protein BJF91_10505 [Allorhizobium taibaishanense]|uniref:Uncharacterized protein n=1 Tax=Allorhizobium taibaishanense TaxID=887144 RepID=A0A1Q8ZYW1_9HYPH|nr:hypothetical protein BJF91_10505 [Allorhizobium taibaishanense]